MNYGMTLSSEEHAPRELVDMAELAEGAGFDFVSISDHFHPWLDEQGHSPFVWSVLGAIAERTSTIDVGVGVTCPTVRIHPAILAHATATTANLFDGRFMWGVGTGEALNEHILGDRWPPAPVRLRQLAEAVDVIRQLWTGDEISFDGEFYRVENARIYDPPADDVPIVVSAFGPVAAKLAAEIGDGLWTAAGNTEAVDTWREAGGQGPVYSQVSMCWAADADKATQTAHHDWRTSCVPGQLSQDLPTPEHFDQAASIVTPEMVAESMPCGPDVDKVLEAVSEAREAGADHIYFHQVGPDQAGFVKFWTDELQPALSDR